MFKVIVVSSTSPTGKACRGKGFPRGRRILFRGLAGWNHHTNTTYQKPKTMKIV